MRAFVPAFVTLSLAAQPAAQQRMLKDLQYLASPDRKGRGNGYPELDQAADYIAAAYRGLGLKPQRQTFPFVARVERTEASLRLTGKDGTLTPAWGRDVEAYGYSADARLTDKAMVFLGFGLQVQGWDDLAGIELKGRVALIAREVPNLATLAPVAQGQRTLLSRLQKLEQAGVAAVIVLEEDTAPRALRKEEGPTALKIPVLSMPCRALPGDLGALLAAMRTEGKPASRDLPAAPRLDLALKLTRREVPVPNVAAVVPGRDPALKAEFIAIGAHLDHLGMGERHSREGAGKVHPGADDNASGTAMVMELARRLKQAPTKRPVLLLHFSGEEEGLLGSGQWIKTPTQPLSTVKFFANFDMVGHLDKARPQLRMGALGAPKAAADKARALAGDLSIAQDAGFAVGGSDHMSFAAAKIPTFFFFTGITSDYHTSADVVDHLNLEGMTTVADVAEKIIRDLADGDQVPAFDPETAKLPVTESRGTARIRFGTIPDFSEHPKGFRIQGTTPGTTAELLGLKAGDVITRFGTHPVKSIYDLMGALSAYAPGDKVVIVWLRDDKEMSGEAVLRGMK